MDPSASDPGMDLSPGPYVMVLGTAQDGGIPQLGGSLNQDGDELPSRKIASLLIADPATGGRWLIDATPDIREQALTASEHPKTRAQLAPNAPIFDGILITHAHTGHYTGLIHFGREAHAADHLPVYATDTMCEFLRGNGPWSLLTEGGYIDLQPLVPGAPLSLCTGLQITPILVPHRAEYSDTVGFVIEGARSSLLYIPDIDQWEAWQTPIEAHINTVTYALLDGTFYDATELGHRDMTQVPHPLIKSSLERFSALSLRDRNKIHFTHLNHTNPACDPQSPATQTILSSGMAVAEDHQIFRL